MNRAANKARASWSLMANRLPDLKLRRRPHLCLPAAGWQPGRTGGSTPPGRSSGAGLRISDAYDLGAEFYRWEVATAFACAVLGVNAFDQPDVQDSKTRTLKKIDAYRQSGKLDEGQPIWDNAGMQAFST